MYSIWEEIIYAGLEYVGLYYGSYPAIVVDNQDPEQRYRIKCHIPGVLDKQIHPQWIPGKYVYGGEGYGTHMLPQVGDMVYVTFRYGKIQNPMWQHGGYAEDELPLEFDFPWKYGFKTPAEKVILIDDGDPDNDNDKGFIIVYNEDGAYWVLDEGNMELMGNDDNAVRYSKLEQAFNSLKQTVDDHITNYNTHTHPVPGVTPGPGSVNTTPSTSPATPSTADISPAKIDEIKVPQ